MQLNPIMDAFYQGILTYAGLGLEDNVVVNINKEIGGFSIDGKAISLPYFDELKNPEGKMFFHLLNENYTNPESTMFLLYKRRLTLELNLKVMKLIASLLTVMIEPTIQRKIQTPELIELIGNFGETDGTLLQSIPGLTSASKKQNAEAFLFDIFLKKNATIGETPYSATGRINFLLPKEVSKAIDDPEKEYKVYGYKLRKKDLIVLNNMFRTLFPDFENPELYIEGSDNKIFRYLNVLLKVSYQITARVNQIATLLSTLNDATIPVDEMMSDHSWTEKMQELYSMATEIRLIPNQTDVRQEAKSSTRLNLDESAAAKASPASPMPSPVPVAPVTPPSFNPTAMQPPVSQPVAAPVAVPQNAAPSAEDILYGRARSPQQQQMMQMPMMQPQMYQMQVPMQPQQPPMPAWAMREQMVNNGVPQPQMYQQPMVAMPQVPMMQTGFPNQVPNAVYDPNAVQMVMTPNGPMMQPVMMQSNMVAQPSSGLALNPHMMPGTGLMR